MTWVRLSRAGVEDGQVIDQGTLWVNAQHITAVYDDPNYQLTLVWISGGTVVACRQFPNQIFYSMLRQEKQREAKKQEVDPCPMRAIIRLLGEKI